MRIGRNTEETLYIMTRKDEEGGTISVQLKTVEVENDLEIYVDSNLDFKTHISGSSRDKHAPRHDPEIIWTLGPRHDTKPIQRTCPVPSGIWPLGLVPASGRSDRWTGKSTAPSYKDDHRTEGPPVPWTLEKTKTPDIITLPPSPTWRYGWHIQVPHWGIGDCYEDPRPIWQGGTENESAQPETPKVTFQTRCWKIFLQSAGGKPLE